jgi:hypothetical protein
MMRIEDANVVLDAIKGIRPEDVDASAVAEMLIVLANHLYSTRKGISMKGIKGSPDWLGYETGLWKISEDIRQWLKKRKDLRGANPVLDACGKVVADARFGKGRQNLCLILGELGHTAYSEVLGALLSDDDVSGHAVKALLQAKATGYHNEVEDVLKTTNKPWIKSLAKKYLEEYRA